MGNQSVRPAPISSRNRNSFSLDFGHDLPTKIKPSNAATRLDPMRSTQHRSSLQINTRIEPELNERGNSEGAQDSSKKLQKLTSVNDQLRKELIRISSELTDRLKKKKYQQNRNRKQGTQSEQKSSKNLPSLKKQLQNAYKQLDMYRRMMPDIKAKQKQDLQSTDLENRIALVERQLDKTADEIRAAKNIIGIQSSGMQRDRMWQAIQEQKGLIESLRLKLKDSAKTYRESERKLMKQHHYMLALEAKVKEINGADQTQEKPSPQSSEITPSQLSAAQFELERLKQKHDEYHKKINAYLSVNRMLSQEKAELKSHLESTTKQVERLSYKRDSLVKFIKDNLHRFIPSQPPLQEQDLSEFDSEEESLEAAEEKHPAGSFDIEHLRDRELKKIPRASPVPPIMQETERGQPKLWQKQLTRVIAKGKSHPQERPFGTGLPDPAPPGTRIVQIRAWLSKKKQMTALQMVYLAAGRLVEGPRSCTNTEQEYKVAFQLEQGDYVKSILGSFGSSGFLEYLVVQSNSGRISRLGREQLEGDNFAIGVAREETPQLVQGASREDGLYWRVSRLHFEVYIQQLS